MRRQGLTLLELLFATTLASLLMVAVLGVVAGLAKTEKALDRHEPPPAWRRRLVDRLSRDLSAADSIAPTPYGFRLTGPLGRDLRSGAADWTPATVEYRLEASPLGPVLVRSLKGALNARQRSVLVFNTAGLVVNGSGEEASLLIQPGELTIINQSLRSQDAVPALVRIQLANPDGDLFFSEVITAQ